MRPGDRVCVAVSGGADSVALLRIILELRPKLGIVVSVAHLHHGIRGSEADSDQAFVTELASSQGLELHLEYGDARAFSQEKKISLETAARELRYQFFSRILQKKKAACIATAHTLDDQAETVLAKALRGAGTRGLAGVFPELRWGKDGGRIVRPLLQTRRQPLRDFLVAIRQPWREDLSNMDPAFTRNRIRAHLLPMLREEINPAVEVALAHLAEISRAEEEYWREQVGRLLPQVVVAGKPAGGGGRRQGLPCVIALDIHKLAAHPLAMRRRLVRAGAEQLGCMLDFEQVQSVLDLLAQRSERGTKGRTIEIQKQWKARLLFRELRIESVYEAADESVYQHRLLIPGEVHVPELGARLRARISEDNGAEVKAAYNRAHSIRLPEVNELIVRNWCAGDRFRPARHATEKRVKELLYPMHLSREEKQRWPVVVAGDRIVWVRGVDSPEVCTASGQRLWIEEA
jgi:tRNA(Ile)-lysidine synthase